MHAGTDTCAGVCLHCGVHGAHPCPWGGPHRAALHCQTPAPGRKEQITIAVLAKLTCSDEYDSRAPYVHLEISGEDADRMKAVEVLCHEVTGKRGLKGLARVAISGPAMYPLSSLPPLSEEQVQQIEDNEYIILEAPLSEKELTHADVTLSCEELHYFVGIGWYAIANDKCSRDIYEADLGAVVRLLSILCCL